MTNTMPARCSLCGVTGEPLKRLTIGIVAYQGSPEVKSVKKSSPLCKRCMEYALDECKRVGMTLVEEN